MLFFECESCEFIYCIFPPVKLDIMLTSECRFVYTDCYFVNTLPCTVITNTQSVLMHCSVSFYCSRAIFASDVKNEYLHSYVSEPFGCSDINRPHLETPPPSVSSRLISPPTLLNSLSEMMKALNFLLWNQIYPCMLAYTAYLTSPALLSTQTRSNT